MFSVSRNPHLCLGFFIFVGKGTKVSSDLPAATCEEIKFKQLLKHQFMRMEFYASMSERIPGGRDFVRGLATVNFTRNALRANSRLFSATVELYDWFTESLNTNRSIGM